MSRLGNQFDFIKPTFLKYAHNINVSNDLFKKIIKIKLSQCVSMMHVSIVIKPYLMQDTG